jgi:hypothetical protein
VRNRVRTAERFVDSDSAEIDSLVLWNLDHRQKHPKTLTAGIDGQPQSTRDHIPQTGIIGLDLRGLVLFIDRSRLVRQYGKAGVSAMV